MKPDLFEAPDYYNLDELLTEEHKLVRDAARDWVKRDVSPIIEEYAQKAEFPNQIISGLAEIGAFGPYIPMEYGGAGLDQISYGLIMQEIERGDSGVRSTASVQSSLVMYPIWKYGNEEQRQKYLPKLASGEWMGCFGLTEPDHGSNPGGMVTNFKDKGDHYLLNGAKMWISNAPFAQVAVVWAKDESGRIHGLIVERGMEGFSTPETHNKWSLRASATGELIFDNVKVPKENLLGQEGKGMRVVMSAIGDVGRGGMVGCALGVQAACLEASSKFANERILYGKPISRLQTIQNKLADMKIDLEAGSLLAYRAVSMHDKGEQSSNEFAVAKYFTTEAAQRAAKMAVDIHGGYGCMVEFPVTRYLRDSFVLGPSAGTSDIMKVIIARWTLT